MSSKKRRAISKSEQRTLDKIDVVNKAIYLKAQHSRGLVDDFEYKILMERYLKEMRDLENGKKSKFEK